MMDEVERIAQRYRRRHDEQAGTVEGNCGDHRTMVQKERDRKARRALYTAMFILWLGFEIANYFFPLGAM